MPVDITEYNQLATDHIGRVVAAGQEPRRTNQQVTAGGVSAQSAAFGDGTKFVRVHTDAAIRIEFGLNPTAAATSPRMAAGSTEFFGVRAGDKAAVITTT